jgi:hypothetical protein
MSDVLGAQEILTIIEAVEPQLWWMLFKAFAATVITMSIYSYIKDIVAFLKFAFAKDIGKHAYVRLNGSGYEGQITHYNRKFIYIKLTDGNELLMPISKWDQQSWVIINSMDEIKRLRNEITELS